MVLGVSSRDSFRDTDAGDPRYLGSGEGAARPAGPSSVLWGHTLPKYTVKGILSFQDPGSCLVPASYSRPWSLRSVFQHEPPPELPCSIQQTLSIVGGGGEEIGGQCWPHSQGYQGPHRPRATLEAHASRPSPHCKAGLQPAELLSTAHAKALGSARKHLFSLVWNTGTHVAQPITFFLSLISSPFSDMVSCSSFMRSL